MNIINTVVQTLGLTAVDKVTGFAGVVTSVAFDLYGCIQVGLTPFVDKDGNLPDARWFDFNRLSFGDHAAGDRVARRMPVPDFDSMAKASAPEAFSHGPAEKPLPR
jgi:hypothetical protein